MNIIRKIIVKILFKIINSNEYKNLLYHKSAENNLHFLAGLKKIGDNHSFPKNYILKNPKYISIGDNFASMYNLRIEAWDEYQGDRFSPEIIIGNNVILNTDVHIGCINKIIIGDNVLLASRVYISDHSHGQINELEITTAPTARTLFSKGPVIIENNVWIGEGVCIMPNVTIGENSIVGANAVVTKNVPRNVVVGGIPARIIKQLVPPITA